MKRGALVLRGALCGFLLLVGLLIVTFSVAAIIDPAGANASDDNDPFGPPPSRLSSTAWLAVGLGVIGGAGAVFMASLRRGRE
jgi:hypothetical protein